MPWTINGLRYVCSSQDFVVLHQSSRRTLVSQEGLARVLVSFQALSAAALRPGMAPLNDRVLQHSKLLRQCVASENFLGAQAFGTHDAIQDLACRGSHFLGA